MWANKKRVVQLCAYGDNLSMANSGKKRRLNHDSLESSPHSCGKEELLGGAKGEVHDADYKLFLKLVNVDVESESEEKDDIDPDYKGFLDHLKADENSYIYEVKNQDGKFVSVKYEKWDESLHETDKERIPALNISSQEKRGFMPKEGIVSEPSTPEDYGPLSPEHENDMGYSAVDESYAVFLSKLTQNEESMFLEYDDYMVRYESDDESGTDSEVEQPACAPEHENDMGYSAVDESYAVFLSKLTQNEESMFLEYDDDMVRYESDDESGTDSEVEQPACAPYCSRQKFQQSPSPNPLDSSMDEDSSCIESPEGASNLSLYREKLMDLLRMPYSEQDYRDLEYLAQTTKPLEKDRELRGRWVSYPTDKPRLSYFDRYHDFKQEFDSAPHHRRFNLLRGFFYYLENLSHEGIFKPWQDPECLEIKPGSK